MEATFGGVVAAVVPGADVLFTFRFGRHGRIRQLSAITRRSPWAVLSKFSVSWTSKVPQFAWVDLVHKETARVQRYQAIVDCGHSAMLPRADPPGRISPALLNRVTPSPPTPMPGMCLHQSWRAITNLFDVSLPFQTQGLWKFVAYGDVAAAMNALPRAGETLNGAWTRQDLLYDSDTEVLSVNPLCISKKDSECFVVPLGFIGVGSIWSRVQHSLYEVPSYSRLGLYPTFSRFDVLVSKRSR